MNKEVEALKAKIAALEGEVKTLRGENLKLYDKLGRKPSVGEKEVARMQKLREEGMTLRQIADDMNVSTSTVYRYLTEENRLKSTRTRTPLYRNRF
ncbi:MAG: helix-turn-helix domain-containing protein [Eubacteriaceae bacterium]|nr:helix-turn-helix domain-containing protein [Eubacteriaceae bacterium]